MLTIDPRVFEPSAVSEETAAFVEKFESMLAKLPATHTVPVEVTRKARDDGKGIFPSGGPLDEGSAWLTIPGAGGREARVRVSRPAGDPRGVYLHIHGGGWTLGRPSHYDLQNQQIAADVGVTVVSIEYRLAPEQPFPAGPEDCEAAARWALSAAEFDGLPFAIGGESAGAHLSVVTLLRLRGSPGFERIKGASLNYGAYDLRMTPSARNWGGRQLVLSTPTIRFFADCATPDPAMREEPLASPILADLRGLPRALFQVGTLDPLMDDTLMMAPRWAEAGCGAEVAVHAGGIHAFDMFDLAISRDFKRRERAFLRDVLDL